MKYRPYLRFWSSILPACVILLSSCGDDEEILQQRDLEMIKEEIQRMVDPRISTFGLRGVSVSVLFPDSRTVNVVGGISDLNVPVAKDMGFGLASITKTAVAATVLRLEEEGLLNLDDPIDKWLSLNSENVDGSVTIFQLLNHFSGIGGYFGHPDFWPTIESNLNQPFSPEELVTFIQPPLFSPGETYGYSNSNYLILGLIIQAAAGESVSEAMRKRFWDPLALPSFFLGAEETARVPLADPWRDMNNDGVIDNIADQFQEAYNSAFYTVAGLFATAEDLAKWGQALYNGDAISQQSRSKMLNFYEVGGQQFWDGYGLGVRRFQISGKELWGHTGGMRGYSTMMLYDPVERITIVILNNQSRTAGGPVFRFEVLEGIIDLVLQPNTP